MIAEGAFAWTLFPTNEKPRKPGLPHICYCLGVAPPLVLVAYTTTAPWPPGVPLPFGVRTFDKEEAEALNQAKPFRLHLNRQAKLRLSKDWFPELETASQGVVAMAPAKLRDEILATATELVKRHRQNIEMLGI